MHGYTCCLLGRRKWGCSGRRVLRWTNAYDAPIQFGFQSESERSFLDMEIADGDIVTQRQSSR